MKSKAIGIFFPFGIIFIFMAATTSCASAPAERTDHELEESDIKIVPAAGGLIIAPGKGPTCRLSAEDGRINGRGEAVLAGEIRRRLAELVVQAGVG